MLVGLFISLLRSIVLGQRLAIRSPLVLKEVHKVPPQWTRLGPAPADHLINLHIGLKQSQMDELERHLLEGEFILSIETFELIDTQYQTQGIPDTVNIYLLARFGNL